MNKILDKISFYTSASLIRVGETIYKLIGRPLDKVSGWIGDGLNTLIDKSGLDRRKP